MSRNMFVELLQALLFDWERRMNNSYSELERTEYEILIIKTRVFLRDEFGVTVDK